MVQSDTFFLRLRSRYHPLFRTSSACAPWQSIRARFVDVEAYSHELVAVSGREIPFYFEFLLIEDV